MRTRHWKQLVRVTGGAVQVDSDTLKRMTLGELLALGLQSKAGMGGGRLTHEKNKLLSNECTGVITEVVKALTEFVDTGCRIGMH